MRVLQLASASVVKGETVILHDLNLTIERGQHTAIIGPNGAGKTALINLLTRDDYALARPGAESPVRVFDSATWDLFALRSRMGIVSADLHQRFVEGNSIGRITGLDAVVSGFFGTRGFLLYAAVTDEMTERAHDALERIEAAPLAGRLLHEMSTGEARRVLIARALVTRPEALVLDEPAAGLDLVARHRFLESVDRIARTGTTVVLITHHVEEVIPAIEQVVLLREGRIVRAGPKAGVLTSAHLSTLFGAPVSVHEQAGYYHARL